jgi:hypothetical protein
VTALVDVLVDLLLRTAVWLAVLVAVAVAVAVLPWAAWGRETVRWRVAALAGIAGALALASLAHRFGFPDPGSVAVWRRPLYPVWTAGGALVGSIALVVIGRRRQPTGQ